MIMERLTQNMQKLYDNGKSQVFWVESSNMVLIVTDFGENMVEQYRLAAIDPDSGEIGGMYVECSGIPCNVPEVVKLMKLGMKLVEEAKK